MSAKEISIADLEGTAQGPFEPIAVVGMGCIMPDAEDITKFWNNIVNAHVSIKEVPSNRWIIDDFWAPGSPGQVEYAKTYAKIGAFVEGYDFDWRRWKAPPGTLGQIDICQQWAVTASAAALEHAGYLGDDSRFSIPNASTGVVMANALGGEFRNLSNHRVWADQFTRQAVEAGGMPESGRDALKQAISEGKPEIDEDAMPGELSNVMAGRVANLLDLQGPNHSTDAACASTMSAVLDACRMLQSRQVDLMLAGASDRTMDPATYAKFSAIGALSPTHSTPFDARADGFVMGEGAGVLVLKRLDDAIEDGNNIHAVIRGIGASSDGRGKGITAPSQRGQMQALARAYAQAGFSPATVDLVEAHGTSTKVGDAMELGTLRKLWHESPAGDNVAVGSVKSQIGHLKAAAGIAGMLKTISAVSKGVIPPSAGFQTPNPTVDWESIPFYVPTYAREWPRPKNRPRRAAVSAFGFGGTNWHVVMEEFDKRFHHKIAIEWRSRWATFLAGPQPVSTTPVVAEKVVAGGIVAKAKVAKESAESILDVKASPSMTWEELKEIEGGILLLESDDLASLKEELTQAREQLLSPGKTFDEDPLGRRLSKELAAASEGFTCVGCRIAIIATSWAEFDKRSALALKTMEGKDKWSFLKSQGILITDEAPLPSNAKVAHMFPGQGSQYVGMTLDLSKRFSGVANVWNQADKTMVDILDGETLSSFVLRSGLNEEERAEAEEKLKQTEYTQPAMLTADLAINQILADHGRSPDMVAGHSLGEYAALMVSGILGMDGALRAAAARGTEMGSVEISDKGLMASVTADYNVIKDVLASIDGYVIAANKNSPKMTVIAGDTPSVKEAIRRFEGLDINCVTLQTSHAFHSTIVEPAAEPLRRFLEGLEINLPEIPITSNVDGGFYPMSRDPQRTAKQQVLDKLAPQMASAVEWTKQIETMYSSGARLFVEVGPKRALTVFASQILEKRPHISMMTNHPKFGGIPSLFNALAEMAVAGRPYRWPRSDSPLLTEGFRAGPIEAWQVETEEMPVALPESEEQDEPETVQPVATTDVEALVEDSGMDELELEIEWIASILAGVSGYPTSMCRGNVDLRSGLGLSDEVVQSVFNSLEKQGRVAADFDTSAIKTAAQICDWVEGVPENFRATVSSNRPTSSPNQAIAPQGQVVHKVVEKVVEKVVAGDPLQSRRDDPFVVTGVSLGLPGEGKVFDDDNFEKLVRGETCISEVPDDYKQKILDKNIVRLIKGRDGQARMEAAEEFGDIPQLAGMAGDFDISEEFGVDAKIARSWDTSTQLAVAAGLIALRDAGIPLTPEEKIGKGGLRLITNWQIPQIYRDRTGVIFSSCFPGSAKTVKHSAHNGADEEGRFDRSYLFQILNMGHSQFAQYTGIRGPNSTINLACASTAASFTLAEDWLTTGRCDRVVIISADNVTGPDLWEWIGSGFAASGAASTSNVIEEAALPFDARRNGLILGMGAAAFVIERKSEAAQRGVQPYAELLGAHIANSSYHGTRLDVEHVAAEVDRFVSQMEDRWGVNRKEIASETFFYSHETYTPARGGSAQAEVRALRETFGKDTDSLVISNTKGFTGHPMGAGIEDASMVHALHTGRAPPIANHKEVDPELGDLNLSKGGYHENMRYGLRFAAGFGSQVAITFMRSCEVQGDRIDMDKLMRWNQKLAGTDNLQLKVLDGKLVAYLDGEDNLHGGVQGKDWNPGEDMSKEAETIPEPAVEAEPESVSKEDSPPSTVESVSSVDKDSVSTTVVQVVVEHTGYPADFIELDQDLEGELGIDTVKQAEIMGDIREKFSLPVDESFILAEHPTLNHMIDYILKMSGSGVASSPVESEIDDKVEEEPVSETAQEPEPETEEQVEPAKSAASVEVDRSEIEAVVLEVVVEHTGYPEDFIELDQDLEGELGIDTVKQAEMMGDIRERFSLPVDESFSLAEHPTLNHFVKYIVKMQSGSEEVVQAAENEVESIPEVVPEPESEPEQELEEQPVLEPEPVVEPEVEPEAKAVVAEPSVSIDVSEVEAKVLQVVVDHTGYPKDFIEMDQDLEGELGIDTVKQAEMMGDIRELFELPVDEQFSLAEHPTLSHFVEYIIRMKGGTVSPPEAVTNVAESEVEEIPWRWSDNVLSEVLAEYHLDDRDELIEVAKKHDDGNRYLKREEIQAAAEELKDSKMTWRYSDNVVSAVLAEHGLDDADALVDAAKKHDDGNRYLKKEELEAGARDLVGDEPPPDGEEESPLANRVVTEEQSQETALQTSPRAGVRRWQVEVEEALSEKDPILLSGTVLVTDDGIGISEEVCSLLQSKGLSTIRVSLELELKEMVCEEHAGQKVYRVDPSKESQINEMCLEIKEGCKDDSLCGILHFAPVQLSGSKWEVGASSRAATLASHSLFGMLKYLDELLASSPSAVVASLSVMDGRHGNIGERFNSLACGASGIVKSYAHERTEIRCRAWDLHPELAVDTSHVADLLVDDLLQNGGDVEVGFDKDLRRWRLVMFDEELVAEPTSLQPDDVWLVSGGGSGVTSAAINGLANSCRNAGAMFVLLGRTEAMDEPAGWLDWNEDQLNQRKMQLREELVAASESGKVSMVEWNKAWQPYLRSRDIHNTIAKIRKSGNKAIYRACDVTDLDSLQEIAKRQGPITGIVHGAGIEDSKLVAEKTWQTFSTVVSIKVDGWKALVSAAEYSGGDLRFAACFTSVAGRLGNGGQTDYAAANSVLDAEMARLTAGGKTRAVATAWTGWKDVGMATRGSLEKIFEAAGIETIPVDKGVSIFVDEVLRGGKRRVMCCGSMGIMDKFESFRAPPLKLPAMMSGLIADPARFPFVDRLLDLQEGERMVSECMLSTEAHPFLVDHSIDGVPYHPGVMALEMFAENALLLLPEFCLAGFENVEFGLPIKLIKGPQKVRVVSELVRRKRDHYWVSCHLESDLVNSKGEVFGNPRMHHKATVRLVRKSNDLTKHMASELHDIPDIGVPASGELQHHPSFIYLRFFHGPRFQSHGGIIRGFDVGEMRGADGIALMRHQLPETDQFAVENEGESILLEALPMLVEAGFQNAGLVTMESDSLMSLPVGIEWMTVLAVPEVGEQLRVRSVCRATEDGGVGVHDVVVVGEDDSPLLSLKGLRLKAMAPLAEEMKFTLDG